MEQHKCLGIYLSADKAVGVLLEGHSGHFKVLDCCSVQKQDDASLAAGIAEMISAKKLKFDEVSVAIDCSLYTQHDLHSDFTDYKQVANTIRFDAEEAVATDAMELAVTFDITNTDETGSDVTVFTAKRDMMTETLTSMLQNGLDPTAMEPDIVCLGRFVEKNNKPLTDKSKLNVIVSPNACYLIIPNDSHHDPCVRSFLVSPSQDITSVLAREVPITIASMHTAEPVTSISVSGRVENINSEEFSLKTGLDVTISDLAETAGADDSKCPGDISQADFAVAYGAALAELAKTRKTDFRKDFMPYEGRLRTIQTALRIFSIAVTLIIVAAGAYFQKSVLDTKRQTKELKNSLYIEDGSVILREPYIEENEKRKFSSKVKSELKKVKSGNSGQAFGDDSSITARLTFVLEAINNTKKGNKIKIDKISIQPRQTTVTGSTASRYYTNDFFSMIDKHPKIKKTIVKVGAKGPLDIFTVTIEAK